ncbi:hypothetical protein CP061683_2057, partial [Chlamydia psittaci 06-1683]
MPGRASSGQARQGLASPGKTRQVQARLDQSGQGKEM